MAHMWGLYESYQTKQRENFVTTKVDYRMQYCDVITNPMAANMKSVISAYFSENWSDYDEIRYTESYSDYDNKKPSCR